MTIWYYLLQLVIINRVSDKQSFLCLENYLFKKFKIEIIGEYIIVSLVTLFLCYYSFKLE